MSCEYRGVSTEYRVVNLEGKKQKATGEREGFWIVLALSLLLAYLGWAAPQYRMPLDYDALLSRSIPLGIIWLAAFALCLWRYGRRAFWVLAGAPMALYWPIWLLFNDFPPCYYSHNCI